MWEETVLVTGGSGFIGSWVARELASKYPKYLVVVYDCFSYCSSPLNLTEPVHLPNLNVVEGDVCDGIHLANLFRSHKFTLVLHLAAESHVDHSFQQATRFVNVNVVGTQVILETIRRSGSAVKKMIQFSTDEVYGEVEGDRFATESDALYPTSPYSAAKASADLLVHAYRKSFGIPAIILRSSNVYGPKQYPEKIIPTFLGQISRGEKCLLQGPGDNVRCYVHARDVASAVDLVIHKGTIGETYNIGSEDYITNIDLLEILLEEYGFDPTNPDVRSKYIGHTKDRPYNDKRYALDYSKLSALGWRPQTPFEQGLKETKEWYQRHGATWWSDML